MKTIMSSAVESELGALFLNSTHAISIRNTLISIGHPQPPTPNKTVNTTALGVVTNTIKSKITKAMDMLFYWVKRSNESITTSYLLGPW